MRKWVSQCFKILLKMSKSCDWYLKCSGTPERRFMELIIFPGSLCVKLDPRTICKRRVKTFFDANIQHTKSEPVFMVRTIRALTKAPLKLFLPGLKFFQYFDNMI